MATWDQIRAGIFAGESGGDYDALYGYRNRQSGPFGNVRVSQMPLRDVLAFTDPQGAYAQSVKGEIGRVATPVGAYQVVGSTLRDAVRGLGLTGDEMFDQATQDRIGRWIYENQGVGAWEGYRGPQPGGMNTPQAVARDTRAALGYGGQQQVSTRGPAPMMPPREQPQGLLQMLGIQPRGEGPQGDRPFYQRDQFRDMAGRLAVAANSLRQRPDQNIPQMVQGNRMQREANRTAEWLGQQEGGAEFAQAILNGANPGEVLMAYRQSRQPAQTFRQVRGSELGMTGESANALFNVGPDGKITAIGGAGTNINVNAGSEVGTIPPGFELFTDPVTGARSMRPIAGGPEDVSDQSAEAASRAQSSVELINSILDDPALPNITGQIQGALPFGLGQEAQDLIVKVGQLEGQAFLNAFESLKGGGQITEREGQAATAAQARLNRTQGTPEYRKSLLELRYIMERAAARASGQDVGDYDFSGYYERISGGANGSAAPASGGNVLTFDPATGGFN